MKIMFIITLVSFAVLAGAAFAILHRIRGGALSNAQEPPESGSSQAGKARLADLTRNAAEPALPKASSVDRQDFSYFNKDRVEQIYPLREKQSDPPRPIRRATAENG